MSAMKAPSSRQTTPLASRALKTAGAIMILASLLDMIILLIPFQASDRQWQINVATQIVDRGIIPLIGIALLVTGYWIDSSSSAAGGRKRWQDSRFWASLLASLLGLLFLLLVFLHPNNVRLNHQQAIERIGQEATQAETQLDNRLTAEVAQQRAQINQLIAASDDQLNQAVQAGAINQEQATLIRQFKEDPSSLDPYLEERVGQLRTQLQTEIGIRREQALRNARNESIKSGIRIGISSLLLAIGYAIIGWTGLKTLGELPASRRST